MNKPVWSSRCWHEDKLWIVSTIYRSYGGDLGNGHETLAWKCDPETKQMDELIFQGSGVLDHQRVCRDLIMYGKIEEFHNE